MKVKEYNNLKCNLYDKEKYVVHIGILKQTLNHGLVSKKVYRMKKFHQKAWSKTYINMNTKLKTETKNDFTKIFFKLMNNSVFVKTMENVRKRQNIKLGTTDKWTSYLVSEPNYHTIKWFSENLLAIKMNKQK